MDHHIQSRCPIVREEDLQLCQIVSVGGMRQAIPFASRLLWLRESSAQLEYTHGGKMLVQGSTFSDFYGYLTSVDNAVEEAKGRCRALSITMESSLVLTIVLTITEKAVIRPETPVIEYGRTKHTRVKDGWMRYVPDQVEAWLQERDWEKRYEIGKPLMLQPDNEVFKKVIWSSKLPNPSPDLKAWINGQGF